MSKKNNLEKSDAARTWLTWGRQAAETLRSKGVDFELADQKELNRKVDSMMVARAYLESTDKPKIHLRYEYPLELFLQKVGRTLHDVFERSLPASIEMTKLFIPFTDGSALLVQMPSEDTVMCANYIKMLRSNDEMAKLMGAEPLRLAALGEVVDLVFEVTRVAPLSQDDLAAYLAREASVAGQGRDVKVQVNLASEKVTATQAVGLLMDFFQTPTDTVSMSVSQFIASEFVPRSKG